MTRGTIKLSKPVYRIELDFDENSLEANGFVRVIRCKDCKYWNGSGKYCDYVMCGHEDDFCSWAKRKEE